MENKTEIDVLDELNKGACMGEDAIRFVLDKVEDTEFRTILEEQYNNYSEILEEISKTYPKYSREEPTETSAMNKAMTWYSLEMKTMFDKSDSKIAELVMQGTNMGIIEGRRLLNHKHSDDRVNDLVQKYVEDQEEAVEKLKNFL